MIETKMRYNLTPIRMSIIKKSINNKNAGEDVEKREPSYAVGGNVVGAATVENSMEGPQKTNNRSIIWSHKPTPGHISGQNYNSKRYMYSCVPSSSIHNSQDKETP